MGRIRGRERSGTASRLTDVRGQPQHGPSRRLCRSRQPHARPTCLASRPCTAAPATKSRSFCRVGRASLSVEDRLTGRGSLGSRGDRNTYQMRGVERLMVKLNDRMVTDVVQTFWAAMARGEFITGAAAEAGMYRAKGRPWLRESGGVRPRRGRDLLGGCVTFPEREEIAILRARGQRVRQNARSLGRSPSTISRAQAAALARGLSACSGTACRSALGPPTYSRWVP